MAGRYLEVAAALTHVRNNPHPPTHPPNHPPTNPSTHQTPQPPCMCYRCTAVRIAADNCGLLSANWKRMSCCWCGCRVVCNPFPPPGCRSCSDTDGFLDRGWGPILPGLRSLYTPQPIDDRPVGLGFPHRARRCRPGKTQFPFPGCRSCRDMEGCLNRGWGPILFGCGGIGRVVPRRNPRRARLAP